MNDSAIEPSNIETKQNEIDGFRNIDHEYLENKLSGYVRVSPSILKVGDHIRYCSNRFQEEGRKCNYGVCQSINPVTLNSFGKRLYPDWVLDIHNKYKQITVYKKLEREFTGFCSECNVEVNKPYFTCLNCRVCKNCRKIMKICTCCDI